MMKKLDILKNMPKSIVLKSDGKVVLGVYGGKKSLKKLKYQKLKDIFDAKAYKRVKKLKKKKSKSCNISWDGREYEVYFNSNIFYFYDITSYFEVESKLKQSLGELTSKKEELQAVFDLAANGISILDRNGMFLYANKFFQNMMEYTMEELYSHSCISLSSAEYAAPSKTAVEKAIEFGSFEKFKKVCVTKSGIHINASMSLAYLQSRDEIIMITSDITEDIMYQDKLKKQVEIEVAKRTQQHEIMCHQSRLAAMGEMIDSIAHQWRQPLNSLGIIVQGLRHISSQKNIDVKFLKEIEAEMMQKLNYMSQTIDDFSVFFRITKQKESFNLLQSIEDAIRLIEIQLKNYTIAIEITKDESLDLSILGFANEFRQVILNMINNAMMAIVSRSVQNGKIGILIKRVKENFQIEIVDNGGGISKEDMPKIFNPYFTTKDKGSGIGLYMSKVIIESHMNGLLRVKNTKDGAKFTIMLKKGY
ncbi:PAS/PAC sensor signal transduction histidine kinase [Sulfurimonas denitrificans DSM 1251]|jgi:PAS domain S-box-containing protein|uniref:histidine kinase n=1 Tax=Sulfurimonas denitrificans (strain ATCC 33889 / DSM 1251) TaxID=326298 RepID=Q30PC6_SULDN|nr:ATP-binding protein [Sulfurimonas denitrificans]ABB45155.1 PAS/PAC sensor signal transduction histidine kinase [Sulfurimonas denitrificans DSM 1251]